MHSSLNNWFPITKIIFYAIYEQCSVFPCFPFTSILLRLFAATLSQMLPWCQGQLVLSCPRELSTFVHDWTNIVMMTELRVPDGLKFEHLLIGYCKHKMGKNKIGKWLILNPIHNADIFCVKVTWSSRSKPGAFGYVDVGDETLDVAASEHKLLLVKYLHPLSGPTGYNELLLPELDVTVGLLDDETWIGKTIQNKINTQFVHNQVIYQHVDRHIKIT